MIKLMKNVMILAIATVVIVACAEAGQTKKKELGLSRGAILTELYKVMPVAHRVLGKGTVVAVGRFTKETWDQPLPNIEAWLYMTEVQKRIKVLSKTLLTTDRAAYFYLTQAEYEYRMGELKTMREQIKMLQNRLAAMLKQYDISPLSKEKMPSKEEQKQLRKQLEQEKKLRLKKKKNLSTRRAKLKA